MCGQISARSRQAACSARRDAQSTFRQQLPSNDKGWWAAYRQESRDKRVQAMTFDEMKSLPPKERRDIARNFHKFKKRRAPEGAVEKTAKRQAAQAARSPSSGGYKMSAQDRAANARRQRAHYERTKPQPYSSLKEVIASCPVSEVKARRALENCLPHSEARAGCNSLSARHIRRLSKLVRMAPIWNYLDLGLVSYSVALTCVVGGQISEAIHAYGAENAELIWHNLRSRSDMQSLGDASSDERERR